MHYIWFLVARTVIISTFLHLYIFVFMHEELTLLVWHWHPKVRLCIRFPLICLSSGNLSLHMPIIWIHLSLWMYILHRLLCKHPSTSLLSLCGKSSRCYKDWWRRSLCWIILAPWCPWSWKSSQLLPIMSPGRKGMFISPLHWWRLLPDRLNNGSWTGGAWMFSCCCNSCAQVCVPCSTSSGWGTNPPGGTSALRPRYQLWNHPSSALPSAAKCGQQFFVPSGATHVSVSDLMCPK